MAGARVRLGDVVAGRYRLDSVAGRGGVGVVHRATDTTTGRAAQVTLLYARIRTVVDDTRIDAVRDALQSLAHPALGVPTDLIADPMATVTAPVEGRSLAGRLAEGALGAPDVLELGLALADGLAALHAAGLVHRWVRPSAVAVTDEGRPVLLDVGITELLKPQYYTAFERLVGTAAYVSPEQVWNEPVGPATDVYALGLVLIEALAGTPVYPGTSAADAVARTLVAPVVPDGIDADLARLLTDATAFRPEARPSAAELAGRLRHLLAPVPVQAAPALVTATAVAPAAAAAFPRSGSHSGSRRRGHLLVTGGLALLAAALLAGGSAGPDSAPSPLPIARAASGGSSALGEEQARSPVVRPTATPTPLQVPSIGPHRRRSTSPTVQAAPSGGAPEQGPSQSAGPSGTRSSDPATPGAAPRPAPSRSSAPHPAATPHATATPTPAPTRSRTPAPTPTPAPTAATAPSPSPTPVG